MICFITQKLPKASRKKGIHRCGGCWLGSSGFSGLTIIHMPAKNITIYEKMNDVGGSMDGTGKAVRGYLCRGEESWSPSWSACGTCAAKAPSLRHKGRTVLDDVAGLNKNEPIHSEYRIIEKCGKAAIITTLNWMMNAGLWRRCFLYAPEKHSKGLPSRIIPAPVLLSSTCGTASTMLAFKKYHSIIEAKRYFRRSTFWVRK